MLGIHPHSFGDASPDADIFVCPIVYGKLESALHIPPFLLMQVCFLYVKNIQDSLASVTDILRCDFVIDIKKAQARRIAVLVLKIIFMFILNF